MSSQIVNEAPLKHLVEQIIINHGDDVFEDEILFEIIKWQKLDLKNAKSVLRVMNVLGLEVCKVPPLRYSVERFGLMRNYFTKAEIKNLNTKHKHQRGLR